MKSDLPIPGQYPIGISGHQLLVGKGSLVGTEDPVLRGLGGEPFSMWVCMPLAPKSEQPQLDEGHPRMGVIAIAERGDETLHSQNHLRMIIVRAFPATVVAIRAFLDTLVAQPIRQTGRFAWVIHIHSQHHMLAHGPGVSPLFLPCLKGVFALDRFQFLP